MPGLSGPRAQRPGRGIARFEARVRSRLDIGRPPATAVGPVRIRLGDVVIDDPDGGAFARAATVEGTLDLEGAFAGRFVVRDVRLEGADVVLARASEGAPWNWERSLASLFGEDRGAAAAAGPAPVVILEGVVVSNTRVVLHPGGADVFEFLDVDARLPVISISVPRTPPLFRLAELTTTVVSPGFERRIEVAISSALVRFPQDEVQFDVARVAVDGSRLLDAAGIWRPDAPGLGLEAALRAEAVSLADARVFVPELPAEGTADFRLAIEPLPEGRTDLRFSDLVARSGSSLVTGALAFAVGGEAPTTLIEVDLGLDGVSIDLLEPLAGPLPYAGTVSGTVVGPAAALDFDLSAELVARENGAPLRSRLTGRVSFGDAGFALVSLEAELQDVPLAALRPLVPGLALTGTVSGRVILRGGPADAPITLDISLVLAEGTILLAGELDLTGPIPTYDLTGRLIGIDLDALFEPALPPVALTARFVLRGSGLSAETATATLQLAGGFTGWEASVTDSVRIVARTAGGVLDLDVLALALASLDLAAAGVWNFTTMAPGGIDYQARITDLEPFGPYLPILGGRVVGGSLETIGRLTGTSDAPVFAGEVDAADVEYDGWFAEAAAGTYTVELAGALPTIELALGLDEITTPGAGVYDTATVMLDVEESRFDLEVLATREDGAIAELVANGRLDPDGTNEAVVTRFNLDLDGERWTLARPTRIEWGDEPGFVVRNLLIVEEGGEGRVLADGAVRPTAAGVLRVEVAALPLGQVLRFAGREDIALSGDLWADFSLRGPADEPTGSGSFRLVEGQYREVPITSFEGDLRYGAQVLDINATVALDTAGQAEVRASLPLLIDLTDTIRIDLVDDGPLRATLVADSLSLAVVPLLIPDVTDAEGRVRARIAVRGTPATPELDGAIQVWNGSLRIPALNQRYEEVSADVVLAGRRAVVRDARARSDGWATATGTITFTELTRPVADLVLTFDGFRPVGVDNYEDAAMWGELQVVGELAGPIVTGDVTMADGNLYIPNLGGDDVIGGEIVPIDGAAFQIEGDTAALDAIGIDEVGRETWFDRLMLDEVIFEAGDNLWFVSDQFRVQLGGELTLLKLGPDLQIFGTLEGELGTFTLRVGPLIRRFDIQSASVRFFGSPEPDPALDIIASRIVPGTANREVEILVIVGGTLSAPTVQLATAQGLPIPESELLSFLLFGQPSFALEDAFVPGEGLLGEALFGVGSLAELASIELEEALIADLGLPLDYVQVRPTTGDFIGFGAPVIVFGVEVDDDVFLTVDTGLESLFGSTAGTTSVWAVRLEWRIDREWRLELGIVPVNRGRLLRSFGTALPVTGTEQQFIVELRRRWTY